MSSPPAPNAEFRLYRRLVTGFVLLFVTLGSAYVLVSVGVTIYRRRNAVPTGEVVSMQGTAAEARGCYDELEDVMQGLRKHLENFHHLLGGYDPHTAQRWSDEGAVWRGQWKALGQRCHFPRIHGTTLRKQWEEMAAAYDELGEIHEIYTNALLRFGRDQAPRLDRIAQRIQRIGGRIDTSGSPPGDSKP